MSERTKDFVGYALIVMLLAFAFSAMSYVSTYSSSVVPSSYRSFSVSAEGKINVKPDIATVSYSVVTEGGLDVATLQEKNTVKGNSIIEFVKSQGVADKDVKTESYNIYPRYTQCYSTAGKVCPPSMVVGYGVSQSVVIKIRKFDLISSLLTGIAQKGATNVGSLSFTVDDMDVVKAEARALAIKAAQKKAVEMANAAGFSLGKVLEVSDDSNNRPYYYDTMMSSSKLGMGIGGGAPSPTVEAGSQDVVVNVGLRYEIR